MQGKRGISALELERVLSMKSYGTTWTVLHKIKAALKERDEIYKLKDIIELDGAPALANLKGVDHDYQVMNNEPEKLDHWLPWVHKFISNAKAWIIGTHHGVESQNLANYLAKYTYRSIEGMTQIPCSTVHLLLALLPNPKLHGRCLVKH